MKVKKNVSYEIDLSGFSMGEYYCILANEYFTNEFDEAYKSDDGMYLLGIALNGYPEMHKGLSNDSCVTFDVKFKTYPGSDEEKYVKVTFMNDKNSYFCGLKVVLSEGMLDGVGHVGYYADGSKEYRFTVDAESLDYYGFIDIDSDIPEYD